MNQRIIEITNRIIERSKVTRAEYLADMKAANEEGVTRKNLHCGNLAHAFAGCSSHEKSELAENETPNLGIITAYNDMLSAHKTFEHYPDKIRAFAIKHQAVAQVAGGVPAMCDGVTQGQVGMELS